MVSTGSSRRQSPEEAVEQLKELFAINAEGNAQLVARLGDFVRDITKAVSDGERADPNELLSRWLNFNLAAFSLLSKQSLAFLDGLLSVANSTLIPSVASPPVTARQTRAEPRVELRLSGRYGERATTGFVIENEFDHPLEVSFDCDDLVSATGQSLPRTLVAFDPATLRIPQRGQAIGQVVIAITREFIIGETYKTIVRLLGFPAKELGLSLVVLPSPEGEDTSRQASEQTKPTARSGPRSSR